MDNILYNCYSNRLTVTTMLYMCICYPQGGSDHYVNKCLILRATIEAVIDDIASIPVADWNSKNSLVNS